jgi:general secretion pathway protein D
MPTARFFITSRLKHLHSLCALLLMLIAAPLAAQSVTLNLKNADLSALISTVSEITGKNFIVDPRVKAKITVVSSKPMDHKEIYDVFLSILDVHGFAVVPAGGGVFKIVPDINAKQAAIPDLGTAEATDNDQMATHVIPVKNVGAAQLVPILRPLIPQQGHLAAYPATNVLVISDRAGNIERISKIVQRIDQASSADVEVIPLEHASAAELARILGTLYKPGPGEAMGAGAQPSFIADERTNSILVAGGTQHRLALRAMIAHLDTPLASTGNTKVIYLRYAAAKDLVEVLKGVGETERKEQGKGETAAAAKQQPFDVQADEATNAVVITAAPDIMRSLEQVIRQLDVRRAQVLVEAIIAEVSLAKSKQLGVQWVVDGTPGGTGPISLINFTNIGVSAGNALAASSSDDPAAAITNLTAGATLGIGRFDDDSINFAVLLQALASDGATNILSTPSLLTLDNTEAEIVIGQNVPFVTGSFTQTGGGGDGGGSGNTLDNPFQTIERQDVGLTLKIKPQINEGDSIQLDIQQESSSLSPNVANASDLITDKRSIKTSVLVDDARMIVLGGLIEDEIKESEQRVPLLGDIPFIGNLFKSRSTTKDKTNLMVFIRPRIVRDDKARADVTGGKYNLMRALQLGHEQRGIKLMPDEKPAVLPETGDSIKATPAPALEEGAAVTSPAP